MGASGKRTRTGTVAIVGRPNVGKSTLLNAMLGEPIAITSRHPQTTRDRILGVLTTKDTQYVFVDTPGLHRARNKLGARMNQEARDALTEADVVLLVTDLSPPPATDEPLPDGVPVVLVINKIDRLKEKSALVDLLQAHASSRDYAALVPISARRKDGVDRVLQEIRGHLPLSPERAYDDDTLTDRPVRFLVAEFVREQILRQTRDEVPHGVAVVCDRFDEGDPVREVPPRAPQAAGTRPRDARTSPRATLASRGRPKVPHIELSIHVDREGHKKILIGKRGALLKEIGTQARARVESLLGRQVHLKLWVRVTPGWQESEAKMRELGYA